MTVPTQATARPPQPQPDADTQPFWDHARQGRLALPRCQSCGAWSEQPMEFCRKCGGHFAYAPVSGEATVYSFLVQHHVVAPGFEAMLAYVIALVSPVEAPQLRLVTRLVDIDPADVRIGQSVRVQFVAHPGGDFQLPVFGPTP
jgi:uncharacterized OB-fold protein